MANEIEQKINEVKAELLKAISERNQTEIKSLNERLVALEKDAVNRLPTPGGDSAKAETPGEILVKSDQYKHFIEGRYRTSGQISVGNFFEQKAAIYSQGTTFTPAQRYPGVAGAPRRMLRIRELLHTMPCSSGVVEFVRRTGETNAAAPQKGEGTLKAESSMEFELVSRPVETLAHWIPASKQVLDDSAMLQNFLNTQLLHMLALREEEQLLTGTGINNELFGLITESAEYDDSANKTGDTLIDTLRRAKAQVALANYYPGFAVLHPDDWAAIDLIKTSVNTGGDYVASTPRSISGLWGLAEIESTAIQPGNFLVGDATGAVLYDRQQSTVEISREHADFFTKNMVAILAEERLALAVLDHAAFCYGAFPT